MGENRFGGLCETVFSKDPKYYGNGKVPVGKISRVLYLSIQKGLEQKPNNQMTKVIKQVFYNEQILIISILPVRHE